MSAAQGVATTPQSTATVVLVGLPESDQSTLQELLDCPSDLSETHCRWSVQPRSSVRSALSALRHTRIQVVLCDRDLMPDAWKELLEQFACLNEPPCLIVTSRLADDHLWAEALNLGAYDVLARPFERAEVVRTVRLARQHWQDRHGNRPELMWSVA
jgi:DNA-binding response OmpR family regulator